MGFRHEMVVAGVGGSGVVWMGTLLARAGSRRYPWVTRFPNFTTSMRGGACECMVIFSSEEIPTPLVFQGDVMMVLDNSQLLPFRNRIRPDGLLITEAAGLPQEAEGLPVRSVAVPALELATSLGDTLVANLVMLGAYMEAADTLAPELVEQELEARFGVAESAISKSVEKKPLLQRNLNAFHLGQDWARRSLVRPG